MPEPRKLTLEELRSGMRVFLEFPDVERSLQEEVDRTIDKILLSKAQNGGRPPVDVLTDYLDAGRDTEERLKVVIGFSRGSLERVKRIYEAMFPGARWSRLWHDEEKRRRIAGFLINQHDDEIFVPPFIRSNFFLPDNWIELLQDEDYLQAIVQGNMQSKYAVGMGEALEAEARQVVEDAGFSHGKGPVFIVDDKEVDIAIPDTSEPQVLIMSSYQITTSSAQSSKANEQLRMYQDVRSYNSSRSQRNKPDVLFVNVIDGGGWLARPNDLQTMWRECDYCFSLASLHGLREVLQHYF